MYNETDTRTLTGEEKIMHHGLSRREGFIMDHRSEIGNVHKETEPAPFFFTGGGGPRRKNCLFQEGGVRGKFWQICNAYLMTNLINLNLPGGATFFFRSALASIHVN